ncbi:hypothetical protein LZ93_003323, partial [Salmonella enterica subsp. enterica]|nr:hypothetical protein [Salmonella enterica subsp. enterica serovar Abaetetuba]
MSRVSTSVAARTGLPCWSRAYSQSSSGLPSVVALTGTINVLLLASTGPATNVMLTVPAPAFAFAESGTENAILWVPATVVVKLMVALPAASSAQVVFPSVVCTPFDLLRS